MVALASAFAVALLVSGLLGFVVQSWGWLFACWFASLVVLSLPLMQSSTAESDRGPELLAATILSPLAFLVGRAGRRPPDRPSGTESESASDAKVSAFAVVSSETDTAVEVFVRREDAERFLETVGAHDAERAAELRLEAVKLEV